MTLQSSGQISAKDIIVEDKKTLAQSFDINASNYRSLAKKSTANSEIKYSDFYGRSSFTCICSYTSIIYNNGSGPGHVVNVSAFLGNPPAGSVIRIDVFMESNGQNEPGGGNDVAYASTPYVVKSVYVTIGQSKSVNIQYVPMGKYWFADKLDWDGYTATHYFQSGGSGHIGWHGGYLYILGAVQVDTDPNVPAYTVGTNYGTGYVSADVTYSNLSKDAWMATYCPGQAITTNTTPPSPPPAPVVVPSSQNYTTPGTYTFTVPAYHTLTVAVLGGGGAGYHYAIVSAGSSAGCEGYGAGTPSYNFTDGNGIVNMSQRYGGTSSFGIYMSATGGQNGYATYGGGPYGSVNHAGVGGTGYGGDSNYTGASGAVGQYVNDTSWNGYSGNGGAAGGYGAYPNSGATSVIPGFTQDPVTLTSVSYQKDGNPYGAGGAGVVVSDLKLGTYSGSGGGGGGLAIKTWTSYYDLPMGTQITITVGAGSPANSETGYFNGTAIGGAGSGGAVFISWS
jgi:hypothetical protein